MLSVALARDHLMQLAILMPPAYVTQLWLAAHLTLVVRIPSCQRTLTLDHTQEGITCLRNVSTRKPLFQLESDRLPLGAVFIHKLHDDRQFFLAPRRHRLTTRGT